MRPWRGHFSKNFSRWTLMSLDAVRSMTILFLSSRPPSCFQCTLRMNSPFQFTTRFVHVPLSTSSDLLVSPYVAHALAGVTVPPPPRRNPPSHSLLAPNDCTFVPPFTPVGSIALAFCSEHLQVMNVRFGWHESLFFFDIATSFFLFYPCVRGHAGGASWWTFR